MNRNQIIVVLSVLGLFLFLFFGCDTKNKDQRTLETSRAISLEATSPELIVRSAKKEIGIANVAVLEETEREIRKASEDSIKAPLIKELSAKWYQAGYPIVAGYYAEEVAKIENSEDSWAIAGTTYALGLKTEKVDKNRSFAAGRAIKAFEQASSMNPDNIDHKLNMAICYTDFPPKNNPMQGILMLRDLNTAYPQSVKVLNQLGRLSIQTGQWENAKKRLSQAYEVDSSDRNTLCMLAQVYTELGDTENASKFGEKCNFK